MKQKILIIEDEPAIVDNISYALKTEGFETIWCGTGNEAIKALESNEITLIILDIGLPDVNGFELCKQIRLNSSVPIIFLTARTDEVDRIVGLEIGGDDYVVKPFSPRELTARVKAILRRLKSEDTSAKENPSEESKPFVIDEERMCIRYFGKQLDLSRYEYRILQTFIENPGRVFSREQLMDIAWDEPDISFDRTVDAHIKNLRNKLRAIHPDFEPIVTRRGFGYSLKELS